MGSLTNNDNTDMDDDDHSIRSDEIVDDVDDDDDDTDVDDLMEVQHQDSFHNIRDELERVRLDKLRQELEALKLQGKISARQRQWELQQAQLKCHMAHTKLQEQLMERTHQSLYMRFWTYEYQEYQQKKKQNSNNSSSNKNNSSLTAAKAIVSPYVLKLETPLLSIMHRAFMVMPNQMEVTQNSYRKHLHSYLSREIRTLRKENALTSKRVVQQLSYAAEENDRLYDEYQRLVEEQERQLRTLRRQLLDLSSDKEQLLLSPNNKKSLHRGGELSETEHSETTYSEEDCTDRGSDDDDGHDHQSTPSVSPSPSSGRFPNKVTKLLLTPTESITKSIGNNVRNLRNLVIATDKFQLPF
ncbi:hypothetical protein IV203_034523 [Nitzschia inconspicua]|uniref:Uncharacterized protein n=1 Tax=Nitzschia inconspicua TaxID=303405 RepID=A0A9K3KAI1_9STRA|nr:hypothetical protein IV203_002681 [Nitzschia inconspicua]KAG7339526.1 hypothetical protein IV203_002579 [Nitzschia inconspicua]KAG7359425.1 hypothetical protein IV203_034523 [Nitzschia inconspicua]